MKTHAVPKRTLTYRLTILTALFLSGCGTAIATTVSGPGAAPAPTYGQPISSAAVLNPQHRTFRQPLGTAGGRSPERTYRAYPPSPEPASRLLPAPPLPGPQRPQRAVAEVPNHQAGDRPGSKPAPPAAPHAERPGTQRPTTVANLASNRHEPDTNSTDTRAADSKRSKTRFVHQKWPGLPGYVVIQPNMAYGHQPEAVGLRWLKRRGFTTVLDLRSDADPAEAPLLRELGLQYINVRLRPDQLWTDAEYARLKEVLTQPQYRPLFIHDKAGERFGALWLTFRVRESGLSVDAALKEVRALKVPDDTKLLQLALEAVRK